MILLNHTLDNPPLNIVKTRQFMSVCSTKPDVITKSQKLFVTGLDSYSKRHNEQTDFVITARLEL